jgi:hypothetical protein
MLRSRISGVLTPFHRRCADALPDDAADHELRTRRCGTRCCDMALPSPEQEVWRYSRIAELDLAGFAPAGVRTTGHRSGAAARR